MGLKFNYEKTYEEIIRKLRKIESKEELFLKEDVPIALNLVKLLELYEKGNFYGIISIKIVGNSTRDLRISEQSFRVKEEKKEFFLDS